MLSNLEKSSTSRESADTGDSNPLTLPSDPRVREDLIDWAYYEAVLLIQRYGNLLEDIQSYMRTGTASVGECALLIEKTLTS